MLIKEKYATYTLLGHSICKNANFQLSCNNSNESGKTQITFMKVKDHNGMVRTNHYELDKYEFVGCVCKVLDNH